MLIAALLLLFVLISSVSAMDANETNSLTVSDEDSSEISSASSVNETSTISVSEDVSESVSSNANSNNEDLSTDDVSTVTSSDSSLKKLSASNAVTATSKTKTTVTGSGYYLVKGAKYNVTLKTSSGKALSNQTVSFKIAGKTYKKTTNANGKATLTINLNKGTYTLVYSFAGSSKYSASSATIKLTVGKSKTTISCSGSSVVKGNAFVVTLKDSSGNKIAKQTVAIRISGKTYKKVTNSTGQASLIINLSKGTYYVYYYFGGSSNYYYSGNSVSLKVTNPPKTKTTLTGSGSSIDRGNAYVVTLKNSTGGVLSGQTVSFKIMGNTYNRTTNSNGKASLTINLDGGNYTLVYSYAGSSKYAASNGSVKLSVIDNSTRFTLSQIETAASNVKTFVENNERLPTTVTVGSNKLSIYEFSYVMAKAISNLNNSNKGSVSLLENISSIKYSNLTLNTTVYRAQYMNLTNRVLSYIGTNKVPATYAVVYSSSGSSVGKASFNLYTFAFSKILVFYKTNSYLPNYCTFQSSVFATSSSSSTSAENSSANSSTTNISTGKVTTANTSQFKTGLNEKNTVSNLSAYLVGANYSAITTSIKNKAASLTKGLNTTAAKAYAIYNYVRDNISYSYYANSKKGASGTLSAGSGNCVDQASLVVALCRASGIYARYSHAKGCTFSSGLVTGHVWAQILVDGVWYTADATSSRNSLGNIKNWNTNSYSNMKQYALVPF